MSDIKDEKVKEIIREKAAEFLERESSNSALITVTNVELMDAGKRALVSFTVFPADKENGALDFAKRKRSEFREVLKRETKLFRLPFVDFRIDLGEKNRQKIDMLSQM
ncbi:MAG: ribosome-binding factor A [Candidatus Taylorbacteria bacterium]|nr:ribosome-binding factor A [Candidatus Taylorbacteria bacterium]